MAFTPGNSNGVLNGTTQVDIVGSPGASTQRVVRNVTFYNRDSAPVEITLKYLDNATLRFLDKQTIQPGESWVYSVAQVLDDTDDKLVAVQTSAPGTNADFTASWADKTAA
jgi:hypothetical protein